MNQLAECTNIIYGIKNKINNKIYIGQTIQSFNQRYHLGLEKHHNIHLRKSINKYGIENFEAIIFEKDVVSQEKLNELEKEYILKFKSYDSKYGYNKTFGGDGIIQTEETKLKISKALKNKPKSKAHRLKLSKSRKGINTLANLTEEQLKERSKKLSKALSGRNNPRYGMTKEKLNKSTIEKLSHASKGKNNPMYGKNIKDYMTPKAYEEWKKNVARHGKDNGRARATLVIYKNKKYRFDYAEEAIQYFKSLGEYITRYWFYKGVSEKYKNLYQYVGYEENYNQQLNAIK